MKKLNLRLLTNNSEIETLCKLYWEIDADSKFSYTVTELEKTFELKKKELLALLRESCIAESTEILCQGCQEPYPFTSRADFQERQRYIKYNWQSKDWLCEDCLLQQKELEEREKADRLTQFKQLIVERYSSERNIIELTSLSLEEATYLLSFCRLCADEDYLLAKPFGSMSFHTRLTPDSKYDYEVLRKLYYRGIISVSPSSPLDAFSGDNAETFNLDRVFWLLPTNDASDHPKDLIAELEDVFRSGDLPEHWLDERLNLWKKIALAECLEYLTHSLQEHKFTLTPGEKTILVVNNLLEDYSVSQIYNFIWRAAKDAAAFMVRTGTNRQHAANTVVGAMQRYGESAKVGNWNPKSFGRNFNCPQTMISQVFFDVVLKIGESGFYDVPQVYDSSNNLIIDEVQ